MRWRLDGLTKWKHRQNSRQQKHRPALRPYGIKGNLQKGFNKCGARTLMRKATYRRVLIGIVHAILEGSCRGNTSQLDKDLTVKNTGQLIKRGDTNLVSRKGGSRLPGTGLGVSIAPFCKTQLACYKKTFTSNAKQKLAVYIGCHAPILLLAPTGRSA